jgi:hypothetical protein
MATIPVIQKGPCGLAVTAGSFPFGAVTAKSPDSGEVPHARSGSMAPFETTDTTRQPPSPSNQDVTLTHLMERDESLLSFVPEH